MRLYSLLKNVIKIHTTTNTKKPINLTINFITFSEFSSGVRMGIKNAIKGSIAYRNKFELECSSDSLSNSLSPPLNC